LTVPYGAGWPVYRNRTVVDFPASALAGLHIHTTGSGVPEAVTESYASGRERRIWIKERLPYVAWEESGPGWPFRGPTLWLTSLESWDQLAGWYERLVADRSELGEELAAHV